ncbi:DsbA family protein [Neptuniibacter sp. QD37_11]|uniref:DsbA family protein n=1 Tax=Neptuniibacter sp. QD37_11 TaxID=3398209 RepID=UPI0039F5AD2A
MKRRTLLLGAAIAPFASLLAGCNSEEKNSSKQHRNLEGKQKAIPNVERISNPIESLKNVDIAEFFWIGCPHCHDLEPHVIKFQKDNKLKIHKIHATLNKRWVDHAKWYYGFIEASQKNMLKHSAFNKIFTEMAERKISSEDEFINSASAKLKIEPTVLSEAISSDKVKHQVEEAKQLTAQSGINGVPKLLIRGEYLVSMDGVKSWEDVLNRALVALNALS